MSRGSLQRKSLPSHMAREWLGVSLVLCFDKAPAFNFPPLCPIRQVLTLQEKRVGIQVARRMESPNWISKLKCKKVAML